MLLAALGLKPGDSRALKDLASRAGVPLPQLKFYDEHGIEPTSEELGKLAEAAGMTELELRLKSGLINRSVIELLSNNAHGVAEMLRASPAASSNTGVGRKKSQKPIFKTSYGALYEGDCLSVMAGLPSNSVDLVFADPPFNLDKLYPSEIDDNLRTEHYLQWCEEWLSECVRLLKDGGSLFLWNLPKWNTYLSAFLNRHLNFRHWIAVDIKYSLPLQSKLYPSHYSLLYYIKGPRPNTFHPDRLPMEVCPDCVTDLKDYGGYKDKMNPLGVNLCDVWNDIPPVRHAKYKKRKEANELSIKLLDRVLEMSSNEGDYVLDPFGGSGTTYAVAELKKRKWIGVEIGPTDGIVERLSNLDDEAEYLERLRAGYNHLFLPEIEQRRKKMGRWTVGNIPKGTRGRKKQQPETETQLSIALES
ncbi:site-specific DNA-methyltransferase [Burkholderia multivorans]|uniref:DNA-methyltransferase n=1 Tax=Burkholderia multivorans TaxID=87883 RepID=UPI00143E4AE4|nr:site-specific DNA-methyltransferase [Burkholderia multivorans]MCL4646161.1 site-specific DNA-methyltransferase [Burkholderia multivorans]MDN7971042.1 site-specific DNA-methyltransferase [Burkholderia multivorans]MDN8010084.1 site-specific DNA-methyltransferase [Burkholderia multivorans]QIX18834.1 site-specific DNA-methyltransferase [Burkholderia multivorans]UQN88717.1 site-specific DNA-methyltransferase [Burkholderia multivorans]